ncbi:hypothetical protein V6M85_05545 [Sulfolobus tengchongensis]|uniref:Uncharacterized protein n=1 Tax=Sulfolobus tengchongensis TaxID=207809 RepID=A0AAX4L5A6_9CREN
MVHQFVFIFLILFVFAPLQPHQYFTYNVQIIYNNILYLYTYNYTVISTSPLSYNFTILNTNGSIVYNRVFTTYNYSLFPPEFVINGTEIQNLTLISVKMENNVNVSIYKGFLEMYGTQIVLNLIYHNNILYQINGTSKNLQIYVYEVNTENNSQSPTIFSYLPLIILLIAIIVAVVVLIKIGKI